MDQETIKFTSPAGIEFEIVKKLNASQRNLVRGVMMHGFDMGAEIKTGDDGKTTVVPTVKNIETDMVEAREHALIKASVKKYGDATGSGTIVLEKLLNSDPDEYDFVFETAEKTLEKYLSF